MHSVVDGEASSDGAAGRVDVERDGLFGGVGFEVEEHGDDAGRGGVVDSALEVDDPFFEEARENVVGEEVAAGCFGDEGCRGPGGGGGCGWAREEWMFREGGGEAEQVCIAESGAGEKTGKGERDHSGRFDAARGGCVRDV